MTVVSPGASSIACARIAQDAASDNAQAHIARGRVAAKTRLLPAAHRIYPWIALLATVVMLLRAGIAATEINHTIDEPYHIGSGLAIFAAHEHILGVQHPPLPRMVAALPLILSGVSTPQFRGDHTVHYEKAANRVGVEVLANSKLGYWGVLIRARLAMLIFPALAMLYLYLLGEWLANPLVAMLSVIFFSFDPTLLAHAAQVTTDMPACAAFLAVIYHGLRWITFRSWRGALAPGVAIGLGISCKFSVVLAIPALALVMALRPMSIFSSRLFRGQTGRRIKAYFRRWPSFRQMLLVGAVAFFTLWATYLFSIGRIGDQDMFTDQHDWLKIPESIKKAEVPMPSLVLGYMFLAMQNKFGHATYINGMHGKMGWWYYFPEAIAIKSPLGMLGAFLLALVVFALARQRRPWRAMMILVPPAVFLGFGMRGHIDIGIRHVLPVLPFLYLFACFVLARRATGGTVVLLALMCAAMIETAWIGPNYLSFFNVAVGGPSQGSKYLIDSNLDWGQNVLATADWLKQQGDKGRFYSIRVFTGEMDPFFEQLGIPAAALPPEDGPDVVPRHGLLAISYSTKLDLERYVQSDGTVMHATDYRWLDDYQPMTVPRSVTGYSILIYDLDQKKSK